VSAAACPHCCTDLNVTCGSGRGCPLVVHYWADLQSVHGLRCYGNITRTRTVSEYMLVLALRLVKVFYAASGATVNIGSPRDSKPAGTTGSIAGACSGIFAKVMAQNMLCILARLRHETTAIGGMKLTTTITFSAYLWRGSLVVRALVVSSIPGRRG